jgi:hypothetical protein
MAQLAAGQPMPSLTRIYWSVVGVIWALALWDSWWARGLFVDGHSVLAGMLRSRGFDLFYGPRANLMAMTQFPPWLAIKLGSDDSHLIARAFSLGLFVVPTLFYHAALYRVRHDPILLAAVICAIGVVFVPTSFFIIGEHNGICAMIVFMAAVLATGKRLTMIDGALLCVTAAILLRSHEVMLVVGPLLAVLVAWRVLAAGWRSWPALLYAVAALLLAAATPLLAGSLSSFRDQTQVDAAMLTALSFWRNIQFVFPLAATVVVVLVGMARPRLLADRRLYLGAGVLLAIIALSPLLWLTEGGVRPFPKSHYETRMGALAFAVAIAVAMFVYAKAPRLLPGGLRSFSQPAVARLLLLFQVATLAAALPSDLLLTELWRRSESLFHETVRSRDGYIPVEETPFYGEPYRHFIENWTLPMQSLVLRSKSGDGIVLPARDYKGWQPFEPTAEMIYLFDFVWRR